MATEASMPSNAGSTLTAKLATTTQKAAVTTRAMMKEPH